MKPPTTHSQILAIVESIPPGRVMTYGSISEHVSGAGARSVGQTLKTDGHDVPWWRVVNAAGRLVPGHERAQSALLRGEGVDVRDGRVRRAPHGRFAR